MLADEGLQKDLLAGKEPGIVFQPTGIFKHLMRRGNLGMMLAKNLLFHPGFSARSPAPTLGSMLLSRPF